MVAGGRKSTRQSGLSHSWVWPPLSIFPGRCNADVSLSLPLSCDVSPAPAPLLFPQPWHVPQKEEAPCPTHSPAALEVSSWEGALVLFHARIGFSGSIFSVFLLVLNLPKRSAQHPKQHLPSCPVASLLVPP